MITDFLYHYKKLLIALLIISVSAISGIFILNKESFSLPTGEITDSVSIIENVKEETLKEDVTESKEETLKEEVTESKEETIIEKPKISVDIKGAITTPGVYEASENMRIHEIISLAGGLTANATTENINLSKKVSDEMVIYVFTKEEYENKTTCKIENEYESEISEEINDKNSLIESNNPGYVTGEMRKISLNNATLEELITIDGLGEMKAKNILEYRSANGGFKAIEELKNVSGIGEAIYEKIKDYFTIE